MTFPAAANFTRECTLSFDESPSAYGPERIAYLSNLLPDIGGPVLSEDCVVGAKLQPTRQISAIQQKSTKRWGSNHAQ